MDYNLEVISPVNFDPLVADEIVASINDSIDDTGQCSLVVAGGKTPGAIYRLLGRPPRVNNVDWSKVHIFWGDDRWVPHDNVSSNYKLLEETLLSNLSIPKGNIHPFNTALKTPKETATAYDKEIKKHFSTEAVPEFSVVLLGIGADGHTASLFPGSDVLKKSDSLAYASEAPEEPKDRVTLSLPVFLSAKRIYFIVKGSGKASTLKQILQGDESVDQLPARFFKDAQGKVSWFADAEAAKELN